MLLGIGILLIVLWVTGFLMLGTVGGVFIHLLLVLAVVTLIWHFFRESTRTV